MNLIEKAQAFSMEVHKGQNYGSHPYSVHLLETYKIAEKFHLSEDIKAACFLHDTIEDTDTTYSEVKAIFGFEIAELVYAVTDELGRDRKERKEKTYIKIVKTGPSAVLLKLCDRIANIENAIENNNPIIVKYRVEHESIKNGLITYSTKSHPIWEHYLNLMES